MHLGIAAESDLLQELPCSRVRALHRR
jgi:hypothetical protein